MRRRYHLGLPFAVYCMLTLLVAVAAMNGGSNLLLWVFALMASSLLVSGIVSGAMLIGLSVRRVVPAHGVAGEPLVIGYAVRNHARLLPAFDLHVEERGESGRAPRGDEGLMRPARAWVMHIGPRETVHGEATYWPQRRGVVRFRRLRIWTTFPFGLVGKSITIAQPQRLVIHPRLYALRRGVLETIAPAGAVGMRVTAHAGAGDDYYGLREFRPGDSLRHIAWKRTANRDQLVCVERTRPNPPRLRVVLSLVSGGGPADDAAVAAREREEEAISLAASIIHAAQNAGYEVGLTVLGAAMAPLPVRRSYWHRNRLMAALAEIDLGAERVRPARPLGLDAERVGLVVVHPGPVDPSVVRTEAWHFSATQLEHLVDPDARTPRETPAPPSLEPEVAA